MTKNEAQLQAVGEFVRRRVATLKKNDAVADIRFNALAEVLGKKFATLNQKIAEIGDPGIAKSMADLALKLEQLATQVGTLMQVLLNRPERRFTIIHDDGSKSVVRPDNPESPPDYLPLPEPAVKPREP
jgi:hypothetical protein